MAGFTKDLFKRGLSWLGGKLGLVKDFAPAVSHEAEVAAEGKAKEIIQKAAAKPTTAAAPALPSLANNTEAYKATQTIKEMAADPSRVNEVVRQSLNVFDSPAAAHYVGDVTRALASAIPQVGPQASVSLNRAVKEGHKALEEQVLKRSMSGLQPGADKTRICSDNLRDAATLLETGATGPSRDIALKAAVKNLDDLEKVSPGAAVGTLARLVRNPQLVRELEETAARTGGNVHLFSADAVLASAKAHGVNNVGEKMRAEGHDLLTRTLDRQFAGNPRAELEWLAQHRSDVIGQIPANILVHRALAAARQLPLNATSPAHDAVVEMVKGVKLTPELDKQVAQFWLDSNIAFRQAGHGNVADQSAMKAIGAAHHASQVSRVAEAEFKVGHIAATNHPKPTAAEVTPSPAVAASSAPPPTPETVNLPDSWGAASNRQTAFNFRPFEQTQAAKQGAQAPAPDPRASLLSESLHPTPARPPRP